MKFGQVPIGEAAGSILAHSLKCGGKRLKKGLQVGPDEIDLLRRNGIPTVTVAQLSDDDVGEDAAAAAIAEALRSDTVHSEASFTGRANLFAGRAGVLTVNAETVNALNRIDPGITLATLENHRVVEAGRMVATVKIIPYAVPKPALDAALTQIEPGGDTLTVHTYRRRQVAVVSTTLPGLKPSIIDKTLRVLGERLRPTGAEIVADERIDHQADAVAAALDRVRSRSDLIVLFGASAIADIADILPSGILAAGGRIEHFGMPVDPGNLLLTGTLGDIPLIGAPGCARSPRENGFDWVLQRLLADVPVTAEDIMSMGVGGLLMEIVSRPQPRAGPVDADDAPKNIAALILAAGRASRMGGPNKLLATLHGKPLVQIVAEAAAASAAAVSTIVTGHRESDITTLFDQSDLTIIHNPNYGQGLSSSLAAGVAALPEDADAVIVLLGDMPGITADIINRLIDAFDPDAGAHIVVPTFNGKRGNPVIWSRRFFDELQDISGDVGARHLIGRYPDAVAEVEIGAEVALDLDTPEALAAAGGKLPSDGETDAD